MRWYLKPVIGGIYADEQEWTHFMEAMNAAGRHVTAGDWSAAMVYSADLPAGTPGSLRFPLKVQGAEW